MQRLVIVLALGVTAIATGAAAQTVSGSGTAGTIPEFFNTYLVGNSPMSTWSGKMLNTGSQQQWEKIGTFSNADDSGEVLTLHYYGGEGFNDALVQQSNAEIQLRQSWSGSCTSICVSGYYFEWGGGSTEIASVEVVQTGNYFYDIYALMNPSEGADEWTAYVSQGGAFAWDMVVAAPPSSGSNILMVPQSYNLQNNALVVTPSGVGAGTTAPIRSLTDNGEFAMTTAAGGTAFFDVSDGTGSNGNNETLVVRGLGSNGTAGVNINTIVLDANTTVLNGALQLSSAGVVFSNGTQTMAYTPTAAALDSVLAQSNGNIGIGTGSTSPGQLLQVGNTYSQNPSIMIGGHDSNNASVGNYSLLFGAWRDAEPTVTSGIVATPSWTCCGGYPASGYAGIRENTLGFYTIYDPASPSTYSPNMFIATSGNVGIGTPTPGSKLDVEGGSVSIGTGVLHVPGGGDGTNPSLHFSSAAPSGFNPGGNVGIWLANNGLITMNAGLSVAGGITFPGGVTQTTAYTPGASAVDNMLSQSGGALSVSGSVLSSSTRLTAGTDLNTLSRWQINDVQNPSDGVTGQLWHNVMTVPSADTGYISQLNFAMTENQPNLWLRTKTGGNWGTWVKLVHDDGNGNVGIGTTVPGADLTGLQNHPASNTPIFEVNGDIAFTQGHGGQIYFADGTTQSTAFNGQLCGGDYAESVDVTGNRTAYEPGDVLVIDPNAPGKFLKGNQAYSTLVAGVYSTKPGVTGRRQTTAKSPDELPMAVVGIVPTKVSAENGPIKTGDLLVASSTLGRAMKGTDRGLLTGAVIGKALGSLESGTGVIEVLVTLE
jgi:hypothetical protein